MSAPLALAGAPAATGIVGLAACAAAALAWPHARGRAAGRLAALVLAPVLLVASLAGSSVLEALGRHPAYTAAGAVIALIALAALARWLARHPAALPVLIVLTFPFRVPIAAAGTTASLLLPLYVVIAAGTLAELVPALLARRRGEPAAEPDWQPGWLERLLAATVLLYAVQAAYSDDLAKALQQMVFFYVPFSLVYALLRRLDWDPATLRRCLIALAGLAVVFGVLGFYEWQTKSLLLNPRLLLSNDFHTYFRVNSFFFDPNVYGRFLAIVAIAVMGAMLWTADRRRLVIGVVLLAALWASLLLTLSQSSLAALLFGLVVLAALRWSTRRTLYVVGGLVAVAVVVLLAAPSLVGLKTDSRTVNNATSGRLSLIQGGIDLFASQPVTGHGSASFAREFRRRHRSGGTGQAVSASHTIPITVAAEQGVPGLLLYLALLAVAARTLLRGSRRRATRAVLAAAFLALVLHTFTYADFLEDPLTWMLLAVGAALASAPARSGRAQL